MTIVSAPVTRERPGALWWFSAVSLTQHGIDGDVVKRLGATVPEGSSALLFESVNEDTVRPEREP